MRKDGVSCFRRFIERREKKNAIEKEKRRSVKLRRDQRCLHMIDKKINNHRNKIICPYLKITSSLYLSYYVKNERLKIERIERKRTGRKGQHELVSFLLIVND